MASIKIITPSVLNLYTNGQKYHSVLATTVRQALDSLDKQYPGIKFRFIDEQDNIRTHMLLFLNGKRITSIDLPLKDGDELFITQNLSGG